MILLKELLSFSLLTLVGASICFAQSTPIGISQVSDLVFANSYPGDAAEVIPPSTVETTQNASFLITGEPSTAYSIDLPRRIDMIHSTATGTKGKIRVESFQSYPAEGSNGLLNSSGQQMLYVGATRKALASNQVTGSYTGTFSVTVVY